MCTCSREEDFQRAFREYYKGKEVLEEDFDTVNALTSTGYLEFYIADGVLFARAGPSGRLFKYPLRKVMQD